jgi:hypothetical protein
VAFVALFCLLSISAVAASFPVFHHDGHHLKLDFLASTFEQGNRVHPDDPGSGGGGTGVIR